MNYARYLDVCAATAKAEYSIPMFGKRLAGSAGK